MSSTLNARRRSLRASNNCASSKTSPLTEARTEAPALEDAAPCSLQLHWPAAAAAAASICCALVAACCSCSHR